MLLSPFRLTLSIALEPGLKMTLMPSSMGLSDITLACLRVKALLGGLEVFWCLCWGNWVIVASGALPVVWEHARSSVLTQPCISQDDILNRLLCALLSPALLPTALGLCFLWPGLGGPHTSQGSHHLSEPTTHATMVAVAPAGLSSVLDLWVRCCLALSLPLSRHPHKIGHKGGPMRVAQPTAGMMEGCSHLGWRDGVTHQPTWTLKEDLITVLLDLKSLGGRATPLSSFKCLLFLFFSLL